MNVAFSDEMLDREIRKVLAMDSANVHGAPTALEMAGRIGTPPSQPTTGRVLLVAALLALLALLVVSAAILGGRLLVRNDSNVVVPPVITPSPTHLSDAVPTPTPQSTAPADSTQNGWLAFSTQPYYETASTDVDQGGDIYLVRSGQDKRLIVSRGPTKASNICPTWSPDGRKLAYGTRDGTTRAIVLLSVADDGSIRSDQRLNLNDAGFAPCPRWSLDGSVIEYPLLSYLGLPADVSPPLSAINLAGDSVQAASFNVDQLTLPCSPTADCGRTDLENSSQTYAAVASSQCTVQIVDPREPPPNPTFGEVAGPDPCPYSFGPWSPDGTQLLLSYDTGDGFTIYTTNVDASGQRTMLASAPTNGARSWPGRFDMSWQSNPHDPVPSANPSLAPVPKSRFSAIFLRPEGPGLGTNVDVLAVNSDDTEHTVTTLGGSVGSELLSRSVVSESGLLARPILLPGGVFAYEISDLASPQSAPFDVTGINQSVDIQGGSAYGPLAPGAVWEPGDVLAIPWFTGLHPTDWRVTYVDGRSHTVETIPDSLPLSVCRKAGSDGSLAQTIADSAGVLEQPLATEPSQLPFNPAIEFACFSPDDSMVAYSGTNGYGLIQTATGHVTPVDGSFAGWVNTAGGPLP